MVAPLADAAVRLPFSVAVPVQVAYGRKNFWLWIAICAQVRPWLPGDIYHT